MKKEPGLSLSSWLRHARHQKLDAEGSRRPLQTVEDLRSFFATCDARAASPEPDWDEHVAVIERSIRGRSRPGS